MKKEDFEESITEESVTWAALAARGIRGRAGTAWLANIADMLEDEPLAPSEAYATHVLTEESVTEPDMEWYWDGLSRSVHAFFKKLDGSGPIRAER